MTLPNEVPPVDLLREAFEYFPETGKLIWRERPPHHFSHQKHAKRWNKSNAGNEAGGVGAGGYLRVGFMGKAYSITRIIWTIHYGAAPDTETIVDHINGNITDNRISNLRLADGVQNQWNARRKRTGKSKLKGAIWHEGNGAWMSNIRVDGKRVHLGYFDTEKEAHAAYVAVSKLVSRGFSFFNRPSSSR